MKIPVEVKDGGVVKVSDWSQKYKLVIYAVSGAGIFWGVLTVISLLREIIFWLQIIAQK